MAGLFANQNFRIDAIASKPEFGKLAKVGGAIRIIAEQNMTPKGLCFIIKALHEAIDGGLILVGQTRCVIVDKIRQGVAWDC
jgi:hypothetical protein